jgi:predicted O-linked N-acetylglucosamine transferase (SPINDLY family)
MTTVETLWMGVPLVTRQGTRWVGRMSQSILAALNLSDWVAPDADRYVETACRLAADLPNLARLRSDLRQRMESSSLCEGPRFAKSLEAAYRGMWEAWCVDRAKAGR